MGEERDRIVIGAKNRAESQILSEMMAILIERGSDLKVVRKYNLEGTFIALEAMKNGDIDIFTDFTGTALVSVLKKRPIKDSKKAYIYVKDEYKRRFDIVWLKPFGFKNNYAFLMLKKRKEELGIKSLEDLLKRDLLFGFDPEFVARGEFRLFLDSYPFQFMKGYKVMDHILLYFSIANGGIDVMNGFTTDPNILHYDLEEVEDIKGAMPQYIAAPLVRGATIRSYPEIEDIINSLEGVVEDTDMQYMNYQVDYLGKSIEDVAFEFLKKCGL